MASFYFKTIDNDGVLPGDLPFEFPDLESAVIEAKTVLAEMALDGLPTNSDLHLQIEVQNANFVPIVRIILQMDVSYLAPLFPLT